MTIGLRKVEIDSLFIRENIWLVCEDTIKTSEIRDHIRTKNEAFGEIKKNLSEFINKLTELFPEHNEILKNTISSVLKFLDYTYLKMNYLYLKQIMSCLTT